MAIAKVQKFKYINGILNPKSVDEYIPMDKTMCISYIHPLLM